MESNRDTSAEIEKLQHRCHALKIIQILMTVAVMLQGVSMYMMWKCITGMVSNISGIIENVDTISDILQMLCSAV